MAEELHLNSPNLEKKLDKSDTLEKVEFEATVERSVNSVFKADDEFLIWGAASVEVVDKEGDKISVEALGKALPQLLKRARLSLEHTDQIVGRILERFSTEEPIEVEINGNTYERSEFPTDVLKLDGLESALYVAGEIYNDTRQSQRTREKIEEGELTSYSISGEALVTRKKVEAGNVYDDIQDIDLSAVTLCEEGMNQKAEYNQIDGEVDDKELAGEGSTSVGKDSSEAPTTPNPFASGSDKEAAGVTKSMSNGDTEGEEKSEEGPSLEDVIKRLPDEGEVATKDDVAAAKSDAVEAFKEQALPEGDLATVKYVDQLVDEKIDEKLKEGDVPEEFEEDEEDEEVEDEEDDMPEDEDEKSSAEEAASILAQKFDLKTAEVLELLSEEEDDEDDPIPDEDEEDDVPQDDEAKVEDEEDDFPEDDEEDDEPLEDDPVDDDEDGDVVTASELEEKLPEDVYKVVCEYIDMDKSDTDSGDTEVDLENDVDDDIQKQVEAVLSGDTDGGSSIPVGEQEDQVDKQYSEPEDVEKEGEGESPALSQFY